MNTYHISRRYEGNEEFIVEALSEDEALDQVTNGYVEPEYKEDNDWGDPEVTDVEYGKSDFEVEVLLTVQARDEDGARDYVNYTLAKAKENTLWVGVESEDVKLDEWDIQGVECVD